MSVAPVSDADEDGHVDLSKVDSKIEHDDAERKENEALMILGIEGDVGEDVRKDLIGSDGLLEAGVVVL